MDADDFVISCHPVEAAGRVLDEIKAWVEANGLAVHPDKTRLGDCRVAGQGL